MKLFFSAENSLYTIFKTLEKIPKWKTVEISISSDHALFDNERWGKQIKETLDKKNIKAVFVTNTEKSKKFFNNIGLYTKHTEKNKFIKLLKMLYLFAFDIKKFHLNTIKNKKTYTFYLVFWFEILFVLLSIYLIYSLILPGARIEIYPSQQIETIIYNFRYYPATDQEYPRYSRFISIPFYTWRINHNYGMSMNTINAKYLQNPSYGKIKIYNQTNKEYSFVPNTRFITDDWRLFQSTNWIEVPAGYNGVPGEVVVSIKAMEKDENEILIGSRWNIPAWTTLYIRNLKQSMFLKEIYATAIDDFTGWTINYDGVITEQDISILSEKLVSHISQHKKNITTQHFNIKDSVLLAFDNTIQSTIKDIIIPQNVWEQSAILNGNINIYLDFLYIKRDDLTEAFSNYINQRPSDKTQLLSINKSSLSFFEEDGIVENDGTFIIPTKIDIIQWYDFKKDIMNIIDDVKAQIVWNTKESARSFILSNPEVASVKIKITPSWYNSIPKLKSRIKVNITN